MRLGVDGLRFAERKTHQGVLSDYKVLHWVYGEKRNVLMCVEQFFKGSLCQVSCQGSMVSK